MFNPHAGVCACRHCESTAPLVWALDAVIPLLTQRVDAYEDPFEAEELALAAALALTFDSVASGVKALLLRSVDGTVDLRRLDAAIEEAGRTLQAMVTEQLRETIRADIDRALRHGVWDATAGTAPEQRLRNRPVTGPLPALDTPAARRVAEHATEAVAFYASRYFSDHLLPNLRTRMGRVLEAASPVAPLDSQAFREAIERSFAARGYWRVVANAAISRAYHYGYLKAAQQTGHNAYRWHSVVDLRTSEVCLTLNGLEFWVADAVNLMESAAMTDDPAAATKLMPWPTTEQVEGATATDLRAAGLLVPPAHPHCRSTLVAI